MTPAARRNATIALFALLFGAAGPAIAQGSGGDANGAEAFVRGVYARYAGPDTAWPYLETADIGTPRLRAVIARVQALQERDDLLIIDYDPLCQCQDPEGLEVRDIAVTATGPDRADAVVRLGYFGDTPTVTLRLEKTAAGWRIDDLVDPAGPYVEGLEAAMRNPPYQQ